MMLETTAAILPSRSFDGTVAFYAKLGFAETGRWADQYLILATEKVEVHFAGHPNLDPSANPAGAYILSSDVDQLSRELATEGVPNEGVPRCHPAETKAWGMRELEIVDPDGNLLRIGQRVDG